MSFPRYPAYKDSGVAWLGELPEHWGVAPVGTRFNVQLGKMLDASKITGAHLRPYLRVFDVQWGDINTDELPTMDFDPADRARFRLMTGDMLVNEGGSYPGRAAIWNGDLDECYYQKALHRLRAIRPSADSTRFFYYVMCWATNQGVFVAGGNESTIEHLPAERFRRYRFAFPALPEQHAIATFLDRETAKIDALVAEQQRLIELLKEKRQAVISHAVTKGLNPDAPMKDSGVEWIGEVPEHWSINRLKYLIREIEQGWSPQCEGYPVETNDEWGVLKVGCVNGGTFDATENKALPQELEPIHELSLTAGDLLISRANTRELVGSAAVVQHDCPNLMLCDKLYRIRLHAQRGIPAFVSRYLSASAPRGQIELGATGASSSMVNIGQSTILELFLAVPPLLEQVAIVDFIDREVTRLDTLTTEATRAIELLNERRTALISAAVTGQIDVREVTA